MLDVETSCRFQNGTAMAELLHNILSERAKEFFLDGPLLLSNAPAARLHNWNLLAPLLKEYFEISITADQKALLVGGGALRYKFYWAGC